MKKIRFIINPVSGFGKHKITESIINEHLDISSFDYEIFYTKAPGHASELCKEAVSQGFDIVAAVGGDGSVNEIGKVLTGSETTMAIIPAGSGNGLARHLSIPMDLYKSIGIINNLNIKKIDTCSVNSDRVSPKALAVAQTYISMAGVGFDAHIAYKFSKSGKRGFWSYLKLCLKEYINYEIQDYCLNIDGNTINIKAFFICFANSSQHGNNAVIAPQAIIDDGYIDVCIIKKFPPYMAPVLMYRLFNKTIEKSVCLEIKRCKEVIIKQNSTLIHLDGEPVNLGKELNVKINPLSLKVIVP